MTIKRFFEFFPTPRYLKFFYVGISFHPDELYFIELFRAASGKRLGRYGKESFKKQEDLFLNEELHKALKKIKEEKGIDYVKVALPEEFTYLFTMVTEGITPEEVKSDIEFHLEENVPLVGSEVIMDYYLIPIKGSQKQKAVVSVVAKETINKFVQMFKDAGITAVSFMVESGALSRSVVPVGNTETHLVIDISEEKSVFAIVSGGFVQFSSTVNFGGGLVTNAIQSHLSVTQDEAKKIKFKEGFRKHSSYGEDYTSAVISGFSSVRDEIQRIFSYWMKQENAETPKNIILSGPEASVPHMADYLSASLQTEVSVGDVWQNVPGYKKEVPPIVFEESVSYGTALGLVITSIL